MLRVTSFLVTHRVHIILPALRAFSFHKIRNKRMTFKTGAKGTMDGNNNNKNYNSTVVFDTSVVKDVENLEDETSRSVSSSIGHGEDQGKLSAHHLLKSTERGKSKIEISARTIVHRRENRIPVTFEIRKKFLETCLRKAQQNGQRNKLHLNDIIQWRDELQERVNANTTPSRVRQAFQLLGGQWNEDDIMLELLNKAVENVQRVESSWFWFRDFSFYFTVVVPASVWLRNKELVALMSLFVFYLFSAVLFCAIIQDDGICPADPSDQDRSYYGWVSSIYFASVTMSTVGYGDLSAAGGSDPTNLKLFIGALYQPLALVVAGTLFASATKVALKGFDAADYYLIHRVIEGYDGESIPLHKQVRNVFWLRMAQLIFMFVGFNFIGVVVARIFASYAAKGDDLYDWSWMTTIYWAIQTTTTVGYGDLDMPFEFRWFQIFFTTFGTALVGSLFAGVYSLNDELQDLKRFYAWKRREVSKRLIEDMKGADLLGDGRVDQYEFLVGSLLMLNKIKEDDIGQIMDKFRDLSGDKGYIVFEDHEKQHESEHIEDMDMMVDMDDDDGIFS